MTGFSLYSAPWVPVFTPPVLSVDPSLSKSLPPRKFTDLKGLAGRIWESQGVAPFYRELPVYAGDATWSMTAREAALLECVLLGFGTGPNLVDKQKTKLLQQGDAREEQRGARSRSGRWKGNLPQQGPRWGGSETGHGTCRSPEGGKSLTRSRGHKETLGGSIGLRKRDGRRSSWRGGREMRQAGFSV